MSSMPRADNLPVLPTSFIGREQEVSALTEAIASARLVTLTGPGGAGKSRLALEVAHQLQPVYPDGIWWVDLSTLSDETLIPQAAAKAIGVSEQPQRRATQAIAERLGSSRALLILDECEHLLAGCASFARALLAACPEVHLIATSREPLGLAGEHVCAVPPLALPPTGPNPDPADLAQCESVRLFLARAAEAVPHFSLTPDNATSVAAICRRLDGLPLAIELAAVRVKVLAPSEIAERLDDAFRLLARGPGDSPPRHQTLRATMDWSFQLLTAPEQVLLRRLSVFAGSFLLEMAEAICGADLADPGVLDLLTNLVEKSLVSIPGRGFEGKPRFHMLETIRQYSREKLEAAGETATLRTRHLEWFAGLVQRLEPKLSGPEASAALAHLDADLDNLRAALYWARASHALELGLPMAGALWMFWQSRGYLVEGRSWLEEFLSFQDSAASAPIPPLVRTKALYAAAALAFRQADYQRATTLAEASLNAAREAQDPARIGVPLSLLAILATENGDYPRAAAMHEEALGHFRRLGDLPRVSNILINLGVIARRQGDYGRARDLYEEALTLKRQMGDKSGAALALSNLGEIAIIQGNLPGATALLEESQLLYGETGNKAGTVAVLNNLGVAARYQGDRQRAQAQFEEALELCQAMADKMRQSLVWINLGDLARDEEEWAQAQTLYADALAILQGAGDKSGSALALHSLGLVASAQHDDERAFSLHQESLKLYQQTVFPLGMVEGLEGIAQVVSRQGDPQRAARWLAAAQARRETMSAPVPRVERDRHEQIVADLRGRIGEATFAATWAEGRKLPLEEAVAEVIGVGVGISPAPAIQAVLQPEWRAFALGESRVLAGERALADSDWTYLKAKELFYYLLTHPVSTKAQIGLELWPEASPAQLRSAFHRTLHHLRRALGKAEWIVFENDTYALKDGLGHWFDVQAFETHLAEARRLLKNGATVAARTQAGQHLEEGLALYRGDFLVDMDVGVWAIFQREELRRRSLEAQLRLGELRFADGRYAHAAEVYRRITEYDPYLETAHRELMRCLARQGEASRAVIHYQTLRQRLRDELATEPAPETTLLYERLRRGDDV